jgi:Periplasmic binding protein
MSRTSPTIFAAPSLVVRGLLLAGLFLISACQSTPSRPPVQIGSGDPRVEPGPTDPAGGQTRAPTEDSRSVRNDGGLTPPFMQGSAIKRAAVLLPFSHPNDKVRAEAESMLAGIELALFEYAKDDFLIMPFDTEGRASIAEARADEAVRQGADIILGPLFGANVAGVRTAADRKNIPVISFSNDRKVAGGGVYLASIMPEEEINRVIAYVMSKGIKSFVVLAPDSEFGRQVELAARTEASRLGGYVAGSAFYDPKTSANAQASQMAAIVKSETARAGTKVGIIIPERGAKLVSIVPQFPINGVDMSKARFLGTSLWDDKAIWREPTLQGAIFASTDPANLAAFGESYKRIYGRGPSDLASVAYDAAALTVRLADEDNLKYNGVTDPVGFMGVNGLFRFRLDGTAERGLAVLEIQPTGPVVIEAGQKQFSPGGS